MSRFFIDRPVFATVIALLITLAGLLAIYSLPIAQYPQITPPTVQVTVTYPGANAETVAKSVGVPIEQEISGVDNLLYFSSTSTNDGTYTMTCTFEIGTDIDQAQVQVQNRARRAEPRLPAESLRRGILVDKVNSDILCVTFLKSNTRDATFLANFATINVRDALRQLPGVGDAVVFGNRDYSMRIWLNPERMSQRQLTVTDVANAIREQNAVFSAGRIGQSPAPTGTQLTVPVIATGRYSTPEEFERIIIRSNPDGSAIVLSDIARIELGSESYDQQNRLDGTPSAGILCYLRPGANALDTVQQIRDTMAELEKSLDFASQQVEWDIPFDTTRFVRVSITEVVHTLFEAAALVALVVFIFLQSWRATLIPLIAVPVSIIGTFAGLLALGFSINTLTLFGLVLAIGIVVDDAIIVVENVERILEGNPKMNVRDATVLAMSQVTGPVIAVVLVLAAVFVPVMFIGGLTGQLYKQFAVTVTVSVALSGLIALTLTPALCRLLLKPRHAAKRGPAAWFNTTFGWLTAGYASGVRYAIRLGVITLLVFGGLLFATYRIFEQVPSGFLPTEDQGYIITAMSLPQGSSVERTSDVVRKVEQFYLSQPDEIEHTVSLSGFDFIAGRIASTNGAVVFTPLQPWEKRKQPNQSADAMIGRAFAGLGSINESIIVAINPPPIQGLGVSAGIEFQLQAAPGADVKQLYHVIQQFTEEMNKHKDLFAVVIQPLSVSVPQMRATVDRNRAKSLGISVDQVYDAMQATFGNLYVNDFEKSGRVWRVQMQAEPNFRGRPDDLSNIYVRNSENGMVPLSAVVDTEFLSGPNAVFRFKGRNAAQFTVPLIPGRSSGEALAMVQEIAGRVLPSGYSVEWSGTSYQEVKAGNQAPILMVMGLVVVFLVLAAQYENWVLPLAVLLAVPFGAFGAYTAVWIRGIPADIYFQIGLLVLIGLVAKNAILIVEFCVIQRKEGKTLLEAAVEAARERLRPILMTSFAFILGVLPLAIAKGAGANARNSIGTGVMGGMIAASTLALFFVPLFFVILQWVSEKVIGKKKAEEPKAVIPVEATPTAH